MPPGDTNSEFGEHSKRLRAGRTSPTWWTCRVELPGAAHMATIKDVTPFAVAIAQTDWGELVKMQAEDLLELMLAPVSFQPSHVEVSPRLAFVAAELEIVPSHLILCVALAQRARVVLETHAGTTAR